MIRHMMAYKLVRKDKSGKYHPLFVDSDEEFIVGEWFYAKEGPQTPTGKVKSKLGPLAYRPGVHLSKAPYAPHIGVKENGQIKYMRPDTVWVLCEIVDTVNYTFEAHQNGIGRNGKFNAQKACLKHIPENGFYWYTTNPNAFGDWLITSGCKVERELSDAEVEYICWTEFGIHAQPRKGGDRV